MTALLFANDLNLNAHKITNLADGSASGDAVNKGQLDTASTADRSRANHTGTQLANTISNFDAAVQALRWQSMLAPNAAVNMGSQKLENVATGVAGTDAVNVAQLNAALGDAAAAWTPKGAVEVLVASNVNIANPGTSTFDGQTITSGQRVLLTAQTTGSQNGPYTFNGSGSAMTRATNWDSAAEAVVGSYWTVNRGTQAERLVLMTNDSFVLGTDTAAFTTFSPGASGDNDSSFSANVGTGSAGPYSVTHSLNSTDVNVVVRELSGGYLKLTNWKVTDANTISLEPDETWATNSHRVTVIKVV